MNLAKEVQNLYSENYKMLLGKKKKDLTKCKNISYSGTWRLNIIKIAILPNLIYKFSAIPAPFFAEIGKLTLKCIWPLLAAQASTGLIT